MPSTIRRVAGATAVAGLALSVVGCTKPGTGTTTTTTSTKPATTVTTRPATTTTTTRPGSSGCGSARLCDTFEDQTGSSPTGRWSVAPSPCGTSFTPTVAVDHTHAHSGSTSLRIEGGGSYCDSDFATPAVDVAGLGPVKHVRFYVDHTTPLTQGHVTFMALRDAGDTNKDLRMGGQGSKLQFNRESDDATLPEQSPAGLAKSANLPVKAWTCVEVRIDEAAGQLQTWVNGAGVEGLTIDGVATPDIDSQWLRKTWRPALTDLRIGWQSYSGSADTVWFDDVAISTARIGC